MAWLLVTLTVHAESVEVLSDALQEAGAMAVDLADACAGTPDEQAIYSQGVESVAPGWQRCTVSALFDEHADIAVQIVTALRAAGLDPATSFGVERVAERDWVRATQNQFQPAQVSPRLWVVPSWHMPPDPAALILTLDPGLAFGTGTHPTTRLCLQWLDANLRGGETVLDYGCGSGILAIAAIKLGAAHATGVDIDAGALLAARRNAMQNRTMVDFDTVNDAAPQAADIVLANILANPLKLLAPLLARATRSGGRIVLSGILEHQAAEMREVYRAWFDMHTLRRDENWVLLSGDKP